MKEFIRRRLHENWWAQDEPQVETPLSKELNAVRTERDLINIENKYASHYAEYEGDSYGVIDAIKKVLPNRLKPMFKHLHPEVQNEGAKLNEDGQGSFTLYHGNAKKINSKEGFLTKYILSGVGDNVFGWGLYFTDVIGIAKDYSKNNTSNENNRLLSLAIDMVGEDVNEIIELFQMQGQWDDFTPHFKNLLLKNRKKKASQLMEKGFLYEVVITPSKPNVFEWYGDVPKDLLTKIKYDGDSAKGDAVYKFLSSQLGSDEKASKYLYSIGYYGIVYPTGTMVASDNEKGKNYVIFNDKDIKITKVTKL